MPQYLNPIRPVGLAILPAFITIALSLNLSAADWPMWRHDAGHGAVSSEQLTDKLHLQWHRQLEKPRRAWTDQSNANIYFDLSYEPVVAGKRVFVGSMNDDSIAAYETESGREIWRHFTGGPVRFAPVVYQSKVYAASDDGFLYCLDASDGTLVWRFQAAPRNDKILGNGRLISRWPVRGAPVIFDNTLYFAASIWAFEGTFIYALDPETGREQWCNSGSGTDWMQQQHHTPAFAGVCPQGYLAASDKVLLVPSGRAVPGGYDRRTGRLLYWQGSSRDFGKNAGGYDVSIAEDQFLNGSALYSLDTGKGVTKVPAGLLRMPGDLLKVPLGVQTEGAIYYTQDHELRIFSLDTKIDVVKRDLGVAPGRVFARAGNDLLCGSAKGLVSLVDVSEKDHPKMTFQSRVDGPVWQMLAADQKLFVVTESGGLFCFGAERKAPQVHRVSVTQAASPENAIVRLVRDHVASKSGHGGYALVVGAESEEASTAVMMHSRMHTVVLDPVEAKVAALRQRMHALGVYGSRVSAIVADPEDAGLPPYMAELIIADDGVGLSKAAVAKLYECLRPYGGTAFLPARYSAVVNELQLPRAEVTTSGAFVCVKRQGALPGSAAWTHQYADAGNSVMSHDDLVKPPFGTLWFGGPSNDNVLPRHGHGPSPQVAGGRLLIEGENMFRCLDVYTGRLLWERQIEGIGHYYRNTGHHPGANEIGSNHISFPDAVYLTLPEKCLKLDPATGETLQEFRLPERSDGTQAHWGFINASGDYLVAAASPVTVQITNPQIPPVSEATFVSETITQLDNTDADVGIAVNVDIRGAKQLLLVLEPADKNVSDHCAWLQPRLTGPNGEQKLTEVPWNWGWSRSLREKPRVGLNDRNRVLTVHRKQRADGIGVHARSAFMYDLPEGFDQFKCRVAVDDTASNSLRGVKAVVHVIKDLKGAGPKSSLSEVQGVTDNDRYGPSSRDLYVLNRQSGEVVWNARAHYNFRHNAIVMSQDKLFCIDAMTADKDAYLKRRGLAIKEKPTLTAFDLATGKVVWRTQENVFGTWLGYSAEHDLLMQAGSRNRDRSWDDVGKGVSVRKASDGELVWQEPSFQYGGPLIIYHDQFITNGSGGRGYSLLTGEPRGWSWSRKYGCNTATASEHLLLFRSSSAAYYDLKNKGGTINFGGFKSGCTSNMVPADGVLSVPDYTRTCTCSYQNQTSLALIHRPGSEAWAAHGKPSAGRVGINLGAEGDRLAADGTYWTEYPLSGSGESANRKISIEGGRYFQHHSLLFEEHPKAWIAASGVEGAEQIELPLEKGRYAVRLYFSEPDRQAVVGQRVFDVFINGKKVLSEFDLSADGQKPRRTTIKSWDGIAVDSALRISLKSLNGRTILCGVEVILTP